MFQRVYTNIDFDKLVRHLERLTRSPQAVASRFQPASARKLSCPSPSLKERKLTRRQSTQAKCITRIPPHRLRRSLLHDLGQRGKLNRARASAWSPGSAGPGSNPCGDSRIDQQETRVWISRKWLQQSPAPGGAMRPTDGASQRTGCRRIAESIVTIAAAKMVEASKAAPLKCDWTRMNDPSTPPVRPKHIRWS